MPTIQSTVKPPAGAAARAQVRIRLVTGARTTPGYTTAGDIIGPTIIQTNDTGEWTADLPANSTITPANTYYEIVEEYPATGERGTSTIIVPPTGGPYTVKQLLVQPPPTPALPAATTDYVDTATAAALAAANVYTDEHGGGGGAVDSVNDQTGAVRLTAADVDADPVGAAADAQTAAGTYTDGRIATVNTALATKADLVSGKIPSAQIPAIALVVFLGSVSSQSAMLALSGQSGDWCIRTDVSRAFFITGADPTQLASWTAIVSPGAPLTSINGQVGDAVLSAADVHADPAGAADTAEAAAADYTDTAIAELDLGTASTHDAPTSGNASATQVVLGNDTRLSGGGGGGTSVKVARSPYDTSGTLTLSASTRTQLTANDLTLAAAAGDFIQIAVNLFADNAKGGFLAIDAATQIAGADNHWVSSETATSRYPGDYPSWYIIPGAFDGPFSPILYQVDASDVDGSGNVTFRLYGEADGDRDVFRSATFPLRWFAINVGAGA